MTTLYIGIDPGMNGGVAAIDHIGGIICCIPMPGTRKQLHDFLYKIGLSYQRRVAAIEAVHSMPKQGVSSTFKFGKGYGEVLGICTALSFEIHEPTPQAWKKEMLAGTDKSKDASIQVAENLFPAVALVLPRCRKAHDGMAEALLMAEYVRRLSV